MKPQILPRTLKQFWEYSELVDWLVFVFSIMLSTHLVADAMAAFYEEKTWIEILEEDSGIDVIKYMNFVRSPESGALATFAGTTRSSFDGRNVIELRYEAYVPMAVRSLQAICTAARSAWVLDAIAVSHRLGTVPVSDVSVFIAVSAVHRSDALSACKYIIDELKASVPIWKKEVYTDGETWKQNIEFFHTQGCCQKKVKDEESEEKTQPDGRKKSAR